MIGASGTAKLKLVAGSVITESPSAGVAGSICWWACLQYDSEYAGANLMTEKDWAAFLEWWLDHGWRIRPDRESVEQYVKYSEEQKVNV